MAVIAWALMVLIIAVPFIILSWVADVLEGKR